MGIGLQGVVGVQGVGGYRIIGGGGAQGWVSEYSVTGGGGGPVGGVGSDFRT